jgi:hypothetical protein
VLDAIPKLTQHDVRHVQRVLGHEVDAHALGADETDDLLDLLLERLGGIVEQQMRLVEEEDDFGLVQIADFRQLLEQFGEQPEQEGGVELRRLHELVGHDDVDHPPPAVRLQEVVQVQRRLAEQVLAALLFQRQQTALDGAHAGGAHVAVFGGELRRVLPDELHQRPQVLQVQQQQAVVVGDLEGQGEDSGLGVVQVQEPRQQQRPHLGDGGAQRMAALAEHVPEGDRAAAVAERLQPQLRHPFGDPGVVAAGLADAGEVPLHVRQHHRHAHLAEGLRQLLQGDGLAGSRGAGDQPVPVGHARQEADLLLTLRDQNRIRHVSSRLARRAPQGVRVRGAPRGLLLGEVGVEPTCLAAADFKSAVSAISPLARPRRFYLAGRAVCTGGAACQSPGDW